MKATHSGHCQVCGGLQKLPSGILSLHGYKVTHGFFSGICHGAKALPFEQAHELVDASIVRAKDALTALEARQARYRAPATKPLAIVNVFVKDARGRMHHEWRQVEVRVRMTDGGFTKFYFDGFEDQPRYGSNWNELTGARYDETDPLAVATKYNTTFAEWLEYEAVSLRRYIKWQEQRVATWTEQPLVPVDAKDSKAAFKPEEPRYAAVDNVKETL